MGTRSEDVSYGVSADDLGNVYISGYTTGRLTGPSFFARPDAFVAKISTIPEPGTLVLGMIAGVGLLLARRR